MDNEAVTGFMHSQTDLLSVLEPVTGYSNALANVTGSSDWITSKLCVNWFPVFYMRSIEL